MASEALVVGLIADCLKFTAVPAGVFEILPRDTRLWIDQTIERSASLARRVSRVAVLVLLAAMLAALVIGWGVYLAAVILYALMFLGYGIAVVVPSKLEEFAIFFALFIAATVVFAFLGMFALWWFEAGSTPSAYSPYLWLERWATGRVGAAGSLYAPDESFADLKRRQADVDLRIYGDGGSYWSLSWWLDFDKFLRFDFYRAAFELGITRVAAGLFVIVFLVLNVGALVLVVSLPVWGASEVIHQLYGLSNWLKARFQLEPKTRIPLLAVVFWALGETLSVALSIRAVVW